VLRPPVCNCAIRGRSKVQYSSIRAWPDTCNTGIVGMVGECVFARRLQNRGIQLSYWIYERKLEQLREW